MSSETPSIKTTAIRGGIWTFGAQGILFLIQIATISTLARLLAPEDFGLVGLLSAVIAVLGLFREMGLATAIVQKSTVEPGELTRIFWLTILFGLALLFITSLCGFAASWGFDEPRLIGIAPWFGLCFLINSIETVPGAILRRNLRFKSIAIRDVIVRFLSFFAALGAALGGMGYKALIVQTVTAATLQLIFTWTAAKWLPTTKASSWGSIRSYAGFGAAFTGSSLASYLTQNVDSLLIGKLFGYQELGFYSRARSLMIQPMNQFMAPIGTVLLPVFCRIQDDQQKFQKLIEFISLPFLILPSLLATWMMVGSSELVAILLGAKWSESIEIFGVLAASIIYMPFGSMLYLVLVSSGRTKLLLHWTWTGALVIISGYAIGACFGSLWIAASFSLTGLILRIPLALYFCGKTGLINRRRLAGVYVATLGIAIVLFVSVYYTRKTCAMFTETPFLLLAGTTIPALVFLAAAFRFHPLAKESVITLKQALIRTPS